MIVGISEQDAHQRLEHYGPNELKDETYRSFAHILYSALREPTVLLLVSIAIIYVLLGQNEEVLSLFSFLILILSITILQERKTEKTLSSLKKLSSPRVIVIRDGKRKKVSGREIVPGDVVLLSEGDRVPADIKLIQGGPVSVDESILTGESLPIEKNSFNRDGSKIYSGTLIIRGQAWGEVIGTGYNTEIGIIGKIIKEENPHQTSLQIQSRKIVNKLGVIAGTLTILIIGFYGLTRHEWLEAFLVGMTLAMAIIPNELPAVLLIFLATGAWRISKRQVLTRKIPAVEALGGITFLCVDKTGTLTQNRMALASLWNNTEDIDLTKFQLSELPESFHEILEFGILASSPSPFDPMEKAFHSAGQIFLKDTEHLHPDWYLSKEYPLTAELLAVSYAWKNKHEDGHRVAAKGAPEAVMELCHFDSSQIEPILKQVKKMASQGLRVIAVANSLTKSLPKIQHDLHFQFVGLVGFADPVRSDARSAVQECQQAGINVIMITGDHPSTAQNIGLQVGIQNCEETLTGNEIEQMDDETLKHRLQSVRIFCRMRSLQKHRIVKLLQESGEIVAMTGDGVNDAPALKKANIGIAMGERGTDVAREAASIVLLDDNFSSIVAAIKVGRRTYRNLQEAFSYLLAIHIPITTISIIPVFFKLPLMLLPLHVAFLHLIIEPVCTIFFEAHPEGPDLMKNPPRKMDDPILGKYKVLISIAQGAWITIVVMGIFIISMKRGHTTTDVRGLTFTSLIFSNLALIFSFHGGATPIKNKRSLIFLTLATVILLSNAIYVPILRSFFRLEILHPSDILICLFAGALSALGLKAITFLNKILSKSL